MASSEGYGMDVPRRCLAIKRLRGESRDDYLLINIDPPLPGQAFGLGDQNIKQIVVATRHQGESLFPIVHWPVYVHVARLLRPCGDQKELEEVDLQNIAWAELYPTEEAARAKRV